MTLSEKLRQRARDARLVAEVCSIHNVNATSYDIQLDEDAANGLEKRANRLLTLINTGNALYEAAHWSPDRDCPADKLWTDFRDALGRKPGGAPTPPKTPKMSPNAIVRRVMEKKFPDRAVIVEGPTDHGKHLVMSVWILGKHNQSGARFGECVMSTREKAANSEESLNDLWKTRAQLLAAILTK